MRYTRLITITMALLVSGLLSAQISRQRMLDCPRDGAGIYRPYFSDRGGQTYSEPLKGYKPFYISHFGRHGSRYLSGTHNIKPTFDCFEAAKAEGLLTPRGDSLYHAIKAVYREHEGMFGELAPLGGREHRGIALRMYEREKPVFSSKKRTRVRSVSSIYPRCLVSMANFTEELSSHAPSLNVTYLAGKRYNDAYISARTSDEFMPEVVSFTDSLRRVHFRPDTLFARYFTDPQKVKDMVQDPYAVEMGLYYFWAICFDLDFMNLDLTPLIPIEELAACAAVGNAYRYAKVSLSKEYGEHTRPKGEKLMKDLLDKAQDALQEGSDVAADLRFIHDSGFTPLCTLLGLDGFPVLEVRRAHKEWNAADVVPMCANLQIIFYKAKDKDVLVKVLVNEKESAISGLTPVEGPYYRWNDLRQKMTVGLAGNRK